MSNVADDIDLEQLWACASADDLKRAADLARQSLHAQTTAVVSFGAGPTVRCVSGEGTTADPFVFASDLASSGVGSAEDADARPALVSVPLLLASGREAGRLLASALPHVPDGRDRLILAGLAAQLMRQIELRHALSVATGPREPLADTRAKLLAVADRIPGLVFERRKVDAGRSAYTFFGSGKTELPAVRQMMETGIAGLNFVHRDDREAVRAAVIRSNLEETDLDLTFRVKDLDRKVRWVRSQSIVRRDADGTVCWNGLCFDVTDLVTAREDAARLSRDVLVSSIDRELREPLEALIGLAQAMTHDDTADRAPSHARNIHRAAGSMIDAIDRMLGRTAEGPPAESDGRGRFEPARATLPQKADPDESRPTTGVRILLADDLDLNRKLVADMLGFDGHVVDGVADGAAAVAAARARAYDLVLMDMIMPGMDGLAATKAIRALPAPACRVPIIALTANSEKEQLDQCLAAGMNAALTKPMSLDQLAAVVATWTRGRKAA